MQAALSALQAARAAVGVQAMPGQESSLVLEIRNLENEARTAKGRADKVSAGATGRIAELEELLPIVGRLVGGLDELERGGEDLDAGTKHLARSSAELVDQLPKLVQGATALSRGTEELAGGTASLAGGLSEANTRSRQIAPQLRDAATKSTENAEALRRRSDQLRALSPGIFDSGYFNLAALAGTPPGLRTRVEQAVNVNRGGQAARILVIPDHDHSVGLDRRLRASTPRLAALIQGTAGVAGGPAQDHDYEEASSSRLPVVVIAVALVTFLCLVLVLRAVIASAIAVLLNLLSVAVAFGALALVSDLPSGALIGNWGYIDTIGAVAIFAIAFGVSIDYSVFILARMREEFDKSNDHKRAVAFGVERTSRVITGAAVMMVAVFAAFATSSLAIVSQLGLGLTVAILIDATVIRLVLLPALLLLVGDRAWWSPSSLDRALRTRGAA